jgi:hypothetical protein
MNLYLGWKRKKLVAKEGISSSPNVTSGKLLPAATVEEVK